MAIRNWSRVVVAAAAVLVFAAVGFADTLELKDGRVLQGRYLGGTQAVLRFEVNGDVQTFPTNDIVALTFTRGSGGPPPAPPVQPSVDRVPQPSTAEVRLPGAPSAPPSDQPPSNQPPGNGGGDVTLPINQQLLVRMIDGVDSSKNQVGDIFHASLETDLYVNGLLVARKGTDVYGKLADAKKSGNFSGKSELQLELTRLVIDGKDYPLVSSDYNVQGKSQGSSTAKKVGGGAILGAIIGGVAGGGKGAAIGAAAGGGAGAGVQILTKGQQVKVPSETLLEFRLQQEVTVTPSAR
jgi:hypothetical protein